VGRKVGNSARQAKPPQRNQDRVRYAGRLRDDGGGLYLQISKGGGKSLVYRYTFDLCRRFALLQLGRRGLRDVDSRTKRFSCSVCGAAAWLTVTNPTTERGMEDYRLDQLEDPERHPAAVDRLLGQRRAPTRPCPKKETAAETAALWQIL